MHHELRNNTLFLRYYQQWQRDPQSIVFAAIADFLLRYQQLDEAEKVCSEGLQRHPTLVTGRLVMAKIAQARGEPAEALKLLQSILEEQPTNQTARRLLEQIETSRRAAAASPGATAPASVPVDGLSLEAELPLGWRTVTMAKIFTEQGHLDAARRIYESILMGDPNNVAARQGLARLAARSG